mmetsp:Transcript_21494/g.30116  ORF Transcript_21494/g.30116 Transcript_21494/m.30116 type:complete len:237 (+) Transcript_21494:157-867(+)
MRMWHVGSYILKAFTEHALCWHSNGSAFDRYLLEGSESNVRRHRFGFPLASSSSSSAAPSTPNSGSKCLGSFWEFQISSKRPESVFDKSVRGDNLWSFPCPFWWKDKHVCFHVACIVSVVVGTISLLDIHSTTVIGSRNCLRLISVFFLLLLVPSPTLDKRSWNWNRHGVRGGMIIAISPIPHLVFVGVLGEITLVYSTPPLLVSAARTTVEAAVMNSLGSAVSSPLLLHFLIELK